MMARSEGFEPSTFRIITPNALTGLSYERFEKGKFRQVLFQRIAITGRDADGHCLTIKRRITLDDKMARQPRRLKVVRELAQRGFIRDGQGYRIGAFRQITRRGKSGSMNEVCSLRANRNVGADDAVVRQVGCFGKINVRFS